MRIVCQKCSAAYAIDDKLVTPKGIRAQCPRCRHLQLVKQDDMAPAMTEPGVPSLAAMGLGSSGFPPAAPPPPPPSTVSDSDLFFDFSAPPTQQALPQQLPQKPAAAPPPPPPAMSFDAGPGDMLDFSDLAAPGPEPATAPRGLAPPPAPLQKASAPKPPPPPPPLAPQSSAPFDFSGDFAFGEPPAPAGGAPLHKLGTTPGLRLKPKEESVAPPPPAPSKPQAAPVVKCKQCGKVLTDPFDQALGICDDCRNAQSNSSSNSLTAADIAGKPTASAAATPVGRMTPAPSAAFDPEPPPSEAIDLDDGDKKKLKVKPLGRQVQSAYREGEEPKEGSGRVVAMALLVVVLFGAGGTYLFIKRPWVKKPPPLAQKLPISSARPIDAMVERWKAQFPELTGSAAEHLAAGEEKLALDTSTGYAEAETEFQKALVLDKQNDRAIAGWALALAFGRGDKVDGDTQKMAEQMLLAAEQRGGDARVYVAHAHLLLVRNANLNDVQDRAERGKQSPSDKDKALAYLALGQAYLSKNPKTAEDNLREAVKADPKLKRAYIAQVLLMLGQGDYRSAVLTLEKRLETDPDQFEAADTLAHLYLEVGETAAAKKTYSKVAAATPAPRPKLALAVLAYQHEADLSGAASQLDALLATKDTLDKQVLIEAYGHRAAVARLQGDGMTAATNADAAIALRQDDANAHLQKLFVAVSAGNGAEARGHLQYVKLQDPALEGAIEARVLLAEGKPGDAFEKLKKVVELDPRRTDALLLAAASAVKAKMESKGWEYVLAKGLKTDPMQSGPRPVMANVFVARSDLIGAARGTFAKLGKEPEDPNPQLAEGLIAWHAGDLGPAAEAFGKVVTADPSNAMAFSYLALISLKKRDLANAAKWSNKAQLSDRTSGLAFTTVGWTQLLQNKAELARKTLQKAVELDPKLNIAKVRLAEADVKVKKVADAKAAMAAVLLSDPSYNDAKRALYGIAP